MSRRLDLNRIKDTFKSKNDRKQRNVYARSEERPVHQDKMESPGHDPSLHLNTKKSSPTIKFNPRNLLPINDNSVEALDSSHVSQKASPRDKGPLPPTPNGRNGNYQARPNNSKNVSSHIHHMADSPERTPLDYTGQDFNLNIPPPNEPRKLLDNVAERLFSDDHLRIILRDPGQFLRFIAFVNRYKPQAAPVLTRFLETQKAIKAVEYANAIADTLGPVPGEHSNYTPVAAALLDGRFEARSKRAFENLVSEALPALITHTLVNVVTDVMVKEITGNTLPVMRDLVAGLNEVFCLTDPSIPDNPIVYASEGKSHGGKFYRTTQYGRDYVIGRNCRFLQGPKTDKRIVARIKAANDAGQESCEVVLNYRRDGTPFLNLLMVAPLYDNRGQVRYFIGAQVDVSGLVEGGRGIESFERLLSDDELFVDQERALASLSNDNGKIKSPLEHLAELGQMFSYEECNTVQSVSRSSSLRDDASLKVTKSSRPPGTGKPGAPSSRLGNRRILGDETKLEENEKRDWGLSTTTLSGRLPGVYQNYLLVRPSPAFKIIFVSPSLRIPGLLQSHFLSRIGGPPHIRNGISDAFSGGVPVTAKVIWLPLGRLAEDYSQFGANDSVSDLGSINRDLQPKDQTAAASSHGKPRWLSCTPLLGSDDKPGVWMVVMVEEERSLPQMQTVTPVPSEKQGGTILVSQTANNDGSGSYERNRYDGSTYVPSHAHQSSHNDSQYNPYKDNTQLRQYNRYDHNVRSDRDVPATPPPLEGFPSLSPPMSKYNTHDDERRPRSARGIRDQDSGYTSAMSPLGMNPARPSTSTATSRTFSLQSTKPPTFETRNTTAMTSPIAGDLHGRRSNERSHGFGGGIGDVSQRTSGNSGSSGVNGMGMLQTENSQRSRGDLRTLRRGEFEGINGSGARVTKERPDDLSDLSDGGDDGENEEEDARNAEMVRERLERDR